MIVYRHTPYNRYIVSTADVGCQLQLKFNCRCRVCRMHRFLNWALRRGTPDDPRRAR